MSWSCEDNAKSDDAQYAADLMSGIEFFSYIAKSSMLIERDT